MRDLTRLPSQTGFAFETAAVLASAAEDSYRNDVGRVASEWGCNASLVEADGDECLVLWDDKRIVFAFRGTEFSWSEWTSNLMAVADRSLLTADLRAHQGFLAATTFLWAQTLELFIYDLTHIKEADVYICGHSRGGAIGSLFAGLMGLPQERIKGIYTFGSPRAVGFELATKLNFDFRGRWFRIVHSNDIVTHTPSFFRWARCPLIPTWRCFHHVGIPVLIKESGDAVFNASIGDLMKEFILGFRLDAGRDHRMHHYREHLDACSTT